MSKNQPNTSAYKKLGRIPEGVKIWKFQNQRSAIDVTHLFNTYREKVKGDSKELLFSGRLCFSISSDGKYLKAYLDKKETKLIFTMIVNGTFSKFYPNGYKSYGGSAKEGKITANIFNIKPFKTKSNGVDTVKFEVSAQEFPGVKTELGAFKPVSGAKPLTEAKTILDPKEVLSMSIECLDFIRASENKAMADSVPMNTLMGYESDRNQVIQERLNGENAGTTNREKTPQPSQVEEKEPVLSQMEPRAFHNLYLKKQAEFQKYQEEYNRRVELKKKSEATQTTQETKKGSKELTLSLF